MKRRNTDQKNVVYQSIDCLGHATMEQIIQSVHSLDSSISVSTIYRNVSVMLIENIIKKFKINQVEVYETIKEKHYHFMCKKCGDIIDLDARKIDERFSLENEIEGNQIEEVEIYFSGTCKKCLDGEIKIAKKN